MELDLKNFQRQIRQKENEESKIESVVEVANQSLVSTWRKSGFGEEDSLASNKVKLGY